METSSFFGKQKTVNILVLVALIAGLAIRMLDLTDLPLDFHPTRQLHSALIARGMYYQSATGIPEWQRDMAVRQWKEEDVLEPQLLERIVASTYLLTGEHIWIARIYSSVFWVLGGLALFLLTRRIASDDGGLIALLYYLFLGFGIIASRSFQPDPLMVALILTSVWSFYGWLDEDAWNRTIITGLLTGLAIFVKPMAAFFLLGAFSLTILAKYSIKDALKNNKIWTILLISIVPIGLYLIDGLFISGFLSVKSSLRFFPQLWIDPKFYIRWYNMIGNTIGTGAFLISLLGTFLFKGRDRWLMIGLWLGYFVYCMTFAYFIGTHNYYQLPLVIVISLSLSMVAKTIFDRIKENNVRFIFPRFFIAVFIVIGISASMWDVRVNLVRDDYRNDAKFWQNLGDILGHTSTVIGITHDYGHRLAYFGWQESDTWLLTGDIKLRDLGNVDLDLDKKLTEALENHQYFVVTLFNQFESQPDVKKMLTENYAVYAEGDGYLIFDLLAPIIP
jgi:hypothetical protein